jgi:HemY protein
MRRVLGWIIVAGIVIAAAWWLMGLPGLVSAKIGDTSLSAPTPVFVLAALALFLVLYVIARLIGGLLRTPQRLRQRRERLQRRNGDAAVTRTLIALAGGDADAAQREAGSSRKLLGDTPQTLLLAAYAGRLAGRDGDADDAFQALAGRTDSAFLGLRGQLQQAIAAEDWPKATDLARRAELANPGAPWLRAERVQLAIRAGSWKEALTLSEPSGPVAALATAASGQESNGSEARRLAKQAWDADPTLAPAAIAYARQLRASGKEARAQEILRSTWSLAPQPDVADYALASAADDLARMRLAETIARVSALDPESSFLLARTALAAGLTGEAQRHALTARELGMNQRRLWLLQAEIAGRMDDAPAQNEALRHAASADPDPVWRCAQCGTAHDQWRPVCDACQTPGRIAWTSGMHASPAALSLPLQSDGVLS